MGSRERLKGKFGSLRKKRALLLGLSAIAVFLTAYALVLPADTLDKDTASRQGGIDITEDAGQAKAGKSAQEQAGADQDRTGVSADQDKEDPAGGRDKADPAGKDASDPSDQDQDESSGKAGSDQTEPTDTADQKKDSGKQDAKKAAAPLQLKAKGKDYRVSAICDADTKLPDNTKLAVKELDPKSKKYDSLRDKALAAVQKQSGKAEVTDLAFSRFFDISLHADGKTLEPAASVDVSISYDKALPVEKKENVRVVHFVKDEKTGKTRAELLDTKDVDLTLSREKMTETAFEADSFSVFGVVYAKQLQKTVISDSGENYEVAVTYGEDAQIPEDAELRVTEIAADSKEYAKNVKLANKTLTAEDQPEVSDPVQFDITIVTAEGEELEPKEGSTVDVEIRLAKALLTGDPDKKKDKDAEEETGTILFNGEEVTADEGEFNSCMVAHITDSGTAEILEGVQCETDGDDVRVQFETDSFSDYTLQGANYDTWNKLNALPGTIYVGDEIYMQDCADIWVTDIGSVVTETKHNNQDSYKAVRAISPGTFRICHKNDWNGGSTQGNGKSITVLPKREGTTPPGTIDTVNNASIGLKMDLFDYDLDDYLDDRFNNYDFGNNNPATSAFLNHGINNGHNLKFWGSGITNGYHGNLNQYVEHGVTSIVESDLSGGIGGYPKLKGYNETLEYLFNPSANTSDRQVYKNVDGLFKRDGDYYVYDSNDNYAYYDPSQGDNGSFVVYNSTYKQKSRSSGGEQATQTENKAIGFFPFHKWDEDYDLFVNWNKNLNHHFGMSMSVDFSLPKDPKAVKDASGNDIVFNFSGDDDMWVFIDGKLAMDIGGIHQPTTGSINFATQKVVVNGSQQNGFDFSKLYDGKKHTLQVFYIERGGCDSNCRIQFNLTQYGDVECDKVDNEDQSTLLPGAVFGLYRDQACTQPLMENLKDGRSHAFVAESDANGHVKFEDVPLGTYYMKEISSPDGYPLDSTVHPVRIYLTETGKVTVKVSIDGQEADPHVRITNRKPAPIELGLKKVWQNMSGQEIQVPSNTKAKFELKRIRTHEEYTDTPVQSEQNVSKLIVGWVHKGKTHKYKEYSLISGSQATVSWSYVNGYTGSKACIVNGTTIDKNYVGSNVVSEALTMPAAGNTATLYIVDDSETGEGIGNINVAGREYIGNSGGGFIREYKTITEPDTGFRYTGDPNVVGNQIELPINSSWQYNFTGLPVFGKDSDTAYTYTYYLEEISTENPSESTVIYKDTRGNVISAPSDAETSASGTQDIINRIRTGRLQINKSVTYNGETPVPEDKKAGLAGTYTFKVFTDENCSVPYKVKQGNAEQDLTLTVTIGSDGAAKSSELVELPVGHYWIEEQTPSQTGVTPEQNRIHVEVKADSTASSPAVADVINNKDESDNPDELAIELEKTFEGLPNKEKIPGDFHVTLSYRVPGSSKPETITLTGSTQGHVTCTKSDDGMTWHWRITHIPAKATDFSVSESNYDIAGYTRVTKINGKTVEDPESPQGISVLQPEITMTNVTSQYQTTDKRKVFTVKDNQILLVRMTNHATVVVSPKSLSIATRKAIEDMIRNNGNKIPGADANATWSTNFVYFSHEIQGDSFSYGGRTIYFEGDTVKIPHNASSHEARVDIGYVTETAQNSFVLENKYTELPTELDILKVEKGKETTTHLQGAVFELRKLEDQAPVSPGGELTYVEGDDHKIIVTSKTTDKDGKLTFDGLTYGAYEIREVAAPPGYNTLENVTLYFRVEGGEINYIEKGTGKPSTWQAADNDDTIHFTPAKAGQSPSDDSGAQNAAFRIGNVPGSELPASGGHGVVWMYLLGSILLIGCGVVLAARRRIRT